MTDISAAIASTEALLLEAAKQATALAVGLQNVAPGNKTETPNKSVQYLFEIADCLTVLASNVKKVTALPQREQPAKLHEVMLFATQQDKEIREKYQIGDKFRFVRDHINKIFASVDELLNTFVVETTIKVEVLTEDEIYAYVYLFNAQGASLPTWQKMLNPTIFYEHSVNRPIYTEKTHVEAFISRKPNKQQHGYLTITIKKHDIFKTEGSETLKDAFNHPLIRVKEGSLRFTKLIAFTHNEQDYVVREDGILVKKIE